MSTILRLASPIPRPNMLLVGERGSVSSKAPIATGDDEDDWRWRERERERCDQGI